jgi:hypothetical protein
MINYQGKLTTAAGAPLNGNFQMVFTIYDAEVGRNVLWTETQPAVVVDKGVFNVLLGSVDPVNNPIPYSIFDGSIRYLGVKVGGDPEITPRKPMVSVAYAYKSFEADTADYARAGARDNDWVFPQSAGGTNPRPYLYTYGPWGIARYGNVLWGNNDSTHVNFGIACTTGAIGQNYKYCTVSGGYNNDSRSDYSTVGGGWNNDATGDYSTVAGGRNNTASSYDATVGGGYNNTASSYWTTVAGGGNNIASALRSTVGGGYDNTASGSDATVGGGTGNDASNIAATVGGGGHNIASGIQSTIGGGDSDTASGYLATIAGGHGNTASGSIATIAGGESNHALSPYTFIGGGYGHYASASHATVGGGYNNASAGAFSTIGGGNNNYTMNLYGTIAGGLSNTAGGFAATIAGGDSNSANGLCATVVGGDHNTASGDYSVAMGRWVTAGAAANTIVLGKGVSNADRLVNNIANSLMVGFNRSTPTLFVDSSKVGIGTSNPQRALHISDVMRLQPRASAPSSPSEGDIYVNSTDHHIYCYLNGVWKQLDN